MTWDDYWASLEASNPGLRQNNKMAINVAVFKEAIRRAFIKGAAHGAQFDNPNSMFGKFFAKKAAEEGM